MFNSITKIYKKIDKFQECDNVFEDFDRFFGSSYTDNAGSVIYQMEVPGFNKDNLKVEITNGILTVSGDRQLLVDNSKIHKQLSVGLISDVEAVVKDGILTIKFKKPEANGRQVEVEEGK